MTRVVQAGWLLAALLAPAALAGLGAASVVQAKPPLLPPEMIAACAKVAVGGVCTLTMGGRSLSGTCLELPDHSRACRPDARGKSGNGKPPTSAPKPPH